MYRLTGATVRDARKEEPAPIVAQSLIRLALTGRPAEDQTVSDEAVEEGQAA